MGIEQEETVMAQIHIRWYNSFKGLVVWQLESQDSLG